MPEKPMTFAEWFSWMEDIFKTNPHAHGWLVKSVHAPSRDTLDKLRDILTGHEGMTIVSEDEAPGNGIIVTR